jgi:hypothetical protein
VLQQAHNSTPKTPPEAGKGGGGFLTVHPLHLFGQPEALGGCFFKCSFNGADPGGIDRHQRINPMQSKLLERLPGDQGRMGGSDLTSDADRLVENTLHRVRAILSSLLVLEYQRQEGRRTLLVLNHESGTGGDAVLKRDILHAAYCPGHVSSVFAFALWSHPIELVRVPGQSVLQLI